MDKDILNKILMGDRSEAFYAAIREINYFCDYDCLGFEFDLEYHTEHSYMQTMLDPIFIPLKSNNPEEYSKQKEKLLEYYKYRIDNLELDTASEQDFRNSVYYLENVYFPRLDK